MSDRAQDTYEYIDLPTSTSFRVMELLPGSGGSPISCVLHVVDWPNPLEYEAISYAWGDTTNTAPITCLGRVLEVTKNLNSALTHLRLSDRSRFLWADAACINQSHSVERGLQIKQMQKIYQNAKTVLIWLGPDNTSQADTAVDSVLKISDFLCGKLGISISDLGVAQDVYQEIIFKKRDTLPLPNECGFGNKCMWNSLRWLYSHSYFTRVWVIQEINANKERLVHCGHRTVEWSRVELVAGYIIMETAFSKGFGFTKAHCWWAAIASTERIRQPKNWLFMLYLASNFSSTDARDAIYGLLGLITVPDGQGLLEPSYNKSTVEVYRDSVEAALVHFENTDVLLYVTGDETPSWVPYWNRPMLFRNPFRFGKSLPWKPAGQSKPIWSIDKDNDILSAHGFIVDTIQLVESYNESCFGNTMIDSVEHRDALSGVWNRIMTLLRNHQRPTPLTAGILTSTATSFSYGLDETSSPADEGLLMRNFVAYLKLVVDEEMYKQIPAEVSEESRYADGHTFGKPVWDFKYPESSFFITHGGLTGCCISTTEPGDVVCALLGSTYPLVLRRDGDYYRIRGYAYVHGIMRGERQDSEREVLKIH